MLTSEAIAALRAALGDEHVLTDRELLADYETATFRTDQAIPAVLRPGSVDEVQAVLRLANQFGFPVYAISTGLNTGYGSRVPPRGGCAVMELKRLDAILEYDAQLGFVRVQPGVTQQMLFDYLRERDAPFWIDCTGSYPDHSLIGNIAERGFGHTSHSDHFAHVAGFEVVLPEGERLRTGFGQYPNAAATPVYRWGLGPHFDGLFTQSNLGVIVEATIWLKPRPEYMQFFACRVDRDEDLAMLIDTLRPLRLDGTINSAMHIGNDYKVVAAIEGYPWKEAQGLTPLPPEVLARKAKQWDCGAWNASGALYGTRAEVRAARRRVRRALRGKVQRLQFLDERLLWLAERVARPYQWVTGVNLAEMLRVVKPVFAMTRGEPSADTLTTSYWRKPSLPSPSPELRPERDRCGGLWLAPVAPTSGANARAIWDVVRTTMLRHGFEPAVTLTLLTERALDCVINVAYDRDVEGEDERAMACHDAMLAQFCELGFYPYRLGIQSMDKLPPRTAAYQRFLEGLRAQLDPRGVLAPGRYLD